ncbi:MULTISPECIES: flagellin [Pelosinus]|uniref:Flagellin n=1 Tax=Pelosinus fermentans B4 TaxID=1149862 RepID=I8RKV7_9FIRM|nr:MULTISPECIES: flagellin [Pelosinus]EIW20913.1 flagellin domain protein [Pelosinus fermentans B4]EIW27220.1 flagellin domain protein [Pelosinus fermentans A11]
MSVVNTNIASLNSWRNLQASQSSMNSSLEKLSSGKKINRAADDASGLAISEKMTSQINGLDQATQNAQNAISLIQTAEGALNETTAIIQRMRTLAVQSRNDTNTDDDRMQTQKEIAQLISEVTRIASTTEFNTKKLVNGSASALTFQIGANASQTMTISIASMAASALGISSLSLSSAGGASQAISVLDAALATVSGTRANLGAVQNRLTHTINNLEVASENLSSARSNLQDTDMAKEMANYSKQQVLIQSGTAMLAQANQSSQSVLKLLQ